MLSVTGMPHLLIVTCMPHLLSVIMLSVVMLSGMAANYGCNPFYSILPWPELILSLAVAI